MSTKKVVVNRCYGGFGVSVLAELEILKRKGKIPFYYKQTKYNHRDGVEEYSRLSFDEVNSDEGIGIHFTLTKDFGPSFSEFSKEVDKFFFYCRDLKRDDPDLIAVVEELGEKSWGRFSHLEIVEIPSDVEYEIEEYDGKEWISEVHRTW